MEKFGKLHQISSSSIRSMDKIKRLNLVNHLSGYKSANLIGTRSSSGQSNLSIVSSVIHLSSSPAVIGFMQRPTTVPRHTYKNILETGFFTINHVHRNFMDKAHYTSAKFEEEESEFEHCGLTEAYLDDFLAPFVEESMLKMSIRYLTTYPIKESNTLFIVGEVESVYLPPEILMEDGQLDLNQLQTVTISGLNNYHEVKQVASYKYARPGVFPENSYS